MADSAESAARKGTGDKGRREDVERVRESGARHLGRQGSPRKPEPVAPMGGEPGIARKPVHPEGQAEVEPAEAPHGSVCTGNVLKLLEFQGYRCALTGRGLTPETTALDHIVPIAQGGEHAIENTQALHKDVNRAKGSLSNDEFLALCREVVRWAAGKRT